jgi:hypothetical protein
MQVIQNISVFWNITPSSPLKSTWRYVPEVASIHNRRCGNLKLYNFISTPAVQINYINIDSSVGIETGCGLNSRGVGIRFPAGTKVFFSPRSLYHIFDGVQIGTRHRG